MQLSVVIPAFNEEKRITSTLQRIIDYCQKNSIQYEIIIVDDGSNDRTLQRVLEIGDQSIKILQNGTNQGKGFSVKRGMLAATKEYILFTDADLSTPIEELDAFLPQLSKFSVIIGSRNLPDSKIIVKQPLFRRLLGNIFPYVTRLFVLRDIHDTQCGFKLFTNKAAQEIFPKLTIKGFCFDVEVLYLAKKLHYKIKELPVTWNNSRDSKVKLIRDPFKMLRDLIKIKS